MNKSKNKHIQNYLNDSKKSINDQLQSLRQHHPAIKHTNNIDIANSLQGNSEGADLSRTFLGSLDMGANAQLIDLQKHLMHTRLTRENELLEEQQLSEQTSKFFKSNQSEIGTLINAFQNHQDENVTKLATKLYATLKQQVGDNTPITGFDPKNLVFTQYDPETNQEEYINFGDLVKNLAQENLPEEHALRLTSGIDPIARDVLQQKQQAIGLELANKQADIDLKRAHAGLYSQQAAENSPYGQQRKLDEFRQKEEIKKDVETTEGKRQATSLLNNAASNLIQTAGSKLLEMNPLEKGVRKGILPATIDPIIGDQEMAYQNLQNAIFSSVQNFRAASELKNIVVPKIGENEKTQVTKLITLMELYGDTNDQALQQKIQQLQNKYKIDSNHLKEFYNKALPKYNALQEEINNSEKNYNDGSLPQDSLIQGMENAVGQQNGSKINDEKIDNILGFE